MKVLKLTHDEGCIIDGVPCGDPSCIYDATNCPALLEEITEMQYGEVGERWLITVEEMPQEEFENLPEFTGW